MSDTAPEESTVEQLLASYFEAQKKRRTARYLMTLFLAIIVVFFILLGIQAVQNFQENEVDDFTVALLAEASDISPMVADELGKAADRAIPKIQDAFVQTFSENEERYVEVLSDNYIALHAYAQAKWPMIEEAIAALVIQQEDTARAALGRYVSPEKLTDLSQAYESALNKYIEGFFSEHFAADMVSAQDIVEKLHQLAETEPDMPPADSQYIMGMFFELLGLEMQHQTEQSL